MINLVKRVDHLYKEGWPFSQKKVDLFRKKGWRFLQKEGNSFVKKGGSVFLKKKRMCQNGHTLFLVVYNDFFFSFST